MNLRDYQDHIAERGLKILTKHKILYLAMEVRTGKTITALEIAYRYKAENILFVTKKKAIASILDDHKNMGYPNSVFATNYESLHKINTAHNFDLIIVDEAHSLGAFPKPSKRTIRLKRISKDKPIIYLSGTPTPESYSQIYHQLWVSSFSPFCLQSNFYRWAKIYVNVKKKWVSSMPINDYSEAKKVLIDRKIEHLFITFSQEAAGFDAYVEEHIINTYHPQITYSLTKQLKNNKIAKYTKASSYLCKVATVTNGADLINKLSQLSGGTLIFDGDDDGTIINDIKARIIQSKFRENKIAIFYKYRAEFELLKNIFTNYTTNPEEFNTRNDLTFLGQIRSAREGVNLSTADALVMYNIDFSATSYWQSRARMQSKERDKPAILYWVFNTGGIEYKIMEAVRKKKNFTYSYYKQCEKETSKESSLSFTGILDLL